MVTSTKMLAGVKSCSEPVVIICSVVVITISIVCAAMVGTKSRQTQIVAQPHSTSKSFDWCLPCDVLANRSTPDLLEKLSKTLVGGVQHCCAYNKEQATLLLELMSSTVVKEVPKTFHGDNFALSKASAHRQLSMPQNHAITKSMFPGENMILEFGVTKKDPLIDHARYITVTQSEMFVRLSGRYYIYSGIFFKPDSFQLCRELPKQIWEHTIVLVRRETTTSEIIFNTTYTCCDTCVQHKKTSYIGGLFDLENNDRLRVEVSSVGVVSFRKEGSYFGLFMLE